MCVYICVYISSRFQWASFCCSVIIISCLDVTLKTDDSIVRLSLIHLKIKKKKYTQGFSQYSKPERIYFFHIGDGMAGRGKWLMNFRHEGRTKSVHRCAHTHMQNERPEVGFLQQQHLVDLDGEIPSIRTVFSYLCTSSNV